MNKSFPIPRGTADILPSQVHVWQRCERLARELCTVYGYQEIRTPAFEDTELFARSVGQSSDIVQKQMLNLASQKTDEQGHPVLSGLSLRPEGTASIVRSYIVNGLDRKEALSKLFYIGPMFRGERPQKGRLRQFHQVGVEAIGPESNSPFLDAEVIALSLALLETFGLSKDQYTLKLNTLGSNEDKEAFAGTLKEKFEGFRSGLCPDCQNRFERNVFRILDCKNEACRRIVSKLDLNYQYLSKESVAQYAALKTALDSQGIAYEEDPHLVRGLDYYTHTVFEITAKGLGSQDAIGAGGRYNGLVNMLGGPKVDAVGFALGLERVLLLLPEAGAPGQSLDTYVIVLEDSVRQACFELVQALRRAGLCADISYRMTSLKSQMRQADKRGAKTVLIAGREAIDQGTVILKEMQSGQQQDVPFDFEQVLESLKRHMRKDGEGC